MSVAPSVQVSGRAITGLVAMATAASHCDANTTTTSQSSIAGILPGRTNASASVALVRELGASDGAIAIGARIAAASDNPVEGAWLGARMDAASLVESAVVAVNAS